MPGIYLDSSASTPVLPEVWDAMRPYAVAPGNPASAHAFGRRSRRGLEEAREQIAAILDARPDEVVFTSGATEANNLALVGFAADPPATIVTSPIEHPSVLEPARRLVEQGYHHRLLPVSRDGVVDILDLDEAPAKLQGDTHIVSMMLANHETGMLQPVATLARCLPPHALLHCDAAAAIGKIPLSFRKLGVHALTLSAHKFHGPPGIGALLVRRGLQLQPMLRGGHQQHGRRPGTEPVCLAVGMAAALAWCAGRLDANLQHVTMLRQRFLDALRAHSISFTINGASTGGLPHLLNLAFAGCQADTLLMNLDLAGVACSAGAACSSGSLLPSPVLTAMGTDARLVASSLRFSFSPLLTTQGVLEAADIISNSVKRLRAESA